MDTGQIEPEDPQGGGRRRATRRLAVAAALSGAAVVALVLYAMAPRGRKDAADACPGARAKAAAMRPLARGEVAALSISADPRPLPPLKFAGPGGAPASLADFRGRTVLFNLWATWCVPCRKEMPALDRLAGALDPRAFAVVTVNIDTAKLDRPRAFWSEAGIAHLAFYADSAADVFQALKGAGKALGLPTTLVIDGNGCDLGVMAGPAQWDSPDARALLSAAGG